MYLFESSLVKKVSFVLYLLFLFFACNIQKNEKSKTSQKFQIASNLIPKIQTINTPQFYTLEERMQYYGVTGFSLTTINNFKIQDSQSYGYCRKEEEILVDQQSIFRAGSISKSVTALLVLKLQAQGILDIDSDIRKYLKSWKLPPNEFINNTKLTLRHLIRHRAGLKKQQIMKSGEEGYQKGDKIFTLNEILNGDSRLQAISFDSKPDEVYKYSNQGYNLIQKIIEDVTNEKFEHLAQRLILEPFGMNNSTFNTVYPSAENTNYCYPYKDQIAHEGYWRNTVGKSGGGLFSTTRDLAKFAIKTANIVNGLDNFVSKDLAQQIFAGEGYGLGFDLIKKEDLFLFSHSGRTPGYYSFMVLDPKKGNGLVMFTNEDKASDLLMELLRSSSYTFDWNLWNPKEINDILIAVEDYDNYLGDYFYIEEKDTSRLTIFKKENQLYYREYSEEETYEYPLIPTEQNIFFDGIDGNKLEFVLDEAEVVKLIYDDEYTFERGKDK